MKISFRTFFLFPVLLSLSSIAKGQASGSAYPEWNIRTSLTSWLEYDAGIMMGVGFRWSDRFSAAIEPTLIFYNNPLNEETTKSYPSGIKLRTDLKIYTGKKRIKDFEVFLSPEFHYKYVESQRQARFGINCINGTCAYFQDAYYTEKKTELGGLLKFGINCLVPFARDPRFLLEMYSGLGSKVRKLRQTDLPAGATWGNPGRRLWFPDESLGIPLIPFGLKIMFILKKPG